jgi:hypothetical protein
LEGNEMDFNKKIALIAAGSLLSVGGLYAVSTSANAAQTPTAPAITSPISGGDVADANEANDVADANEANDVADANEANDVEGANEANDAEGANEGAEVAGE